MSGFDSLTPIAPIVPPKYLSVAGIQVWPPSVVLKTPPPVVPIQYSLGRDAEPATATERPPRKIPISRHFRAAKTVESYGVAWAGAARTGSRAAQAARTAKAASGVARRAGTGPPKRGCEAHHVARKAGPRKGPLAACRFPRSHERAHHPATHFARQHVGVEPRPAKQRSGIRELVHASRLYADLDEAVLGEEGPELSFLERARHAAHPELHVPADGGRNLAAHDHVRHREPSAGLEHAERFGEHSALVRRQVDHAVRDDHVHRRVGQRDALDVALQELHVRDAGLALVLPRQRP